ncbi:MAG: hypothetical protein IIC33_04795 [Chloroflexi bacterium]|nr:hypothetical protein [Chloroflexota bacterium]
MIDRITILGGSSVYTPEFILSLVSHNINVKEIVIFGRETPKLPLVTAFCQRLVKKSRIPAKVTASTNLEEAVDGAKYVLNHVRVGGMKARLRDEKNAPKQGMIGDQSLGAGGFANAMRTLPVVMDFANRIEKVNPGCTFINLTNPMGVVVEALIKHSKLNVIGVCDLPGTYVKKIADLLHRNPCELYVDYIGLNHMGWIQDVRIEGRSCMSTLLEKIEQQQDDGFDNALCEVFRMIPTRTVSLFFHTDEILKKQKTCSRYRAEALHEAEQQILKLYEDKRLSEIPALTRQRNTIWYEETIVPLIAALESNKEQNLIVCVQNNGSIRDLPDDCSVEVPAQVSRRGLTPRKVGSCPRFLRGLFMAAKESDRLTVEAVYHKSYDYALQALTINPLVPSLEAALRYLDRLIKLEKLELH